MKILIMGYGKIGTHIHKEFESKNNEISIFDKYKKEYTSEEVFSKHFDATFISVPTERNEDGSVNTTEVFDAVNKALNCSDVVIIRSAIPVGTCESFNSDKVVISPEYYGTTQHAELCPNFAILGGKPKARSKAVQIYQSVKKGDFRFIFTDWKTAELTKYVENTWLATKVTFCNEMYRIAKSMGIEYEELRECWLADSRVNPSHTFVYEKTPYWDSHCLNKDIPGLINQCDKAGYDAEFIKSMWKCNYEFKNEK